MEHSIFLRTSQQCFRAIQPAILRPNSFQSSHILISSVFRKENILRARRNWNEAKSFKELLSSSFDPYNRRLFFDQTVSHILISSILRKENILRKRRNWNGTLHLFKNFLVVLSSYTTGYSSTKQLSIFSHPYFICFQKREYIESEGELEWNTPSY